MSDDASAVTVTRLSGSSTALSAQTTAWVVDRLSAGTVTVSTPFAAPASRFPPLSATRRQTVRALAGARSTLTLKVTPPNAPADSAQSCAPARRVTPSVLGRLTETTGGRVSAVTVTATGSTVSVPG